MGTEIDNFSDSEDEIDNAEAIEFDEESKQMITKTAHEGKIAELTQELESVKLAHSEQLSVIKVNHTSIVELFQKEREAHSAEMAKRQTRIDFLMDQIISK